MRLLSSAQRNLQHPAALMLMATVVLATVFGLGAVEQRKTLLAASVLEMASTHVLLASTLHFRNGDGITKILLPALETKPKKVWMRAVHVDGEILATVPVQKNNAVIPTPYRNSGNRMEVLTSVEWPTTHTLANSKPAYAGKLAGIPFMNAQFMISIPVFSAIDPLRTDVSRSAYQEALGPSASRPQQFVAGYVEQSIFLGEIISPMLPTLGFVLLISAIAGIALFFILRGFVERLDSQTAQLAALMDRTDALGLPQKIEPTPQFNENLQQIAFTFNQLISDRQALHELGNSSDVEAADNATQQKSEAYFDPVTNLPSRQLLMEQMALLMDIAARERRHVGLVLLEIGNIGEILKTQGREVSDQVLREIASRILKSVRKSDIISRGYDAGGPGLFDADQFCVVLHGINGTGGALSAAQRLLDLLRDPVNEAFMLQVVAGAAVAPLHSETPEGLVNAAKKALIAARNSKDTNAIPFFQEEQT